MLTNDIPVVEAHLQSRIRLLEEEKGNLINRVVELEKSIVQQREEKEALAAQHNQALLQVWCGVVWCHWCVCVCVCVCVDDT